MKKHEIVLKKTNKRDAGSFLLFVFLLPYICACLWGHVGEETERLREEEADRGQQEARLVEAGMEWGVWELTPEEYLAYRLLLVMPGEHEVEALKAQAVLLRTELAVQFREEGERIAVEGDGLAGFYAERGRESETLAKCRQAAEETAGEILTYQGEPIRASYFRVSNGSTRAAGEECPYLHQVSCEQDRRSPDHTSVAAVEKDVYMEALAAVFGEGVGRDTLWEGLAFTFDDAGYVTEVSCITDDQEKIRVDGETFRHLFGLASASFEIVKEEERVLFYVTGVGHGFGMSQYGADCRAKEGEDYREILADFFFDTELEKIE